MKLKSIHKTFFFTGISMGILSIFMFLIGIGIFSSTGQNPIKVRLGEFCFAFWLPFLVIGFLLSILGVILYLIKSSTK